MDNTILVIKILCVLATVAFIIILNTVSERIEGGQDEMTMREEFVKLAEVKAPKINEEDDAKRDIVISTRIQDGKRIIIISQRLTAKFAGKDKQMFLKGSIPTTIDGLVELREAIDEAIENYTKNF